MSEKTKIETISTIVETWVACQITVRIKSAIDLPLPGTTIQIATGLPKMRVVSVGAVFKEGLYECIVVCEPVGK